MLQELNCTELNYVNGGGAVEVLQAFVGGVMIGTAPIVGVATSIITSPTGPISVAAGIGAAASMISAGAGMINEASN